MSAGPRRLFGDMERYRVVSRNARSLRDARFLVFLVITFEALELSTNRISLRFFGGVVS
jgi:hypothetical protein